MLRVIKELQMTEVSEKKIKYVVKDEHTLGYIYSPTESKFAMMGVLSSKIGGHHPNGGPVSISYSKIRDATKADFEIFRVVVPPDFEAKS
jgi:hypothetical protein